MYVVLVSATQVDPEPAVPPSQVFQRPLAAISDEHLFVVALDSLVSPRCSTIDKRGLRTVAPFRPRVNSTSSMWIALWKGITEPYVNRKR